MKMLNFLISKIKKRDYELDSNIRFIDIFFIVLNRLCGIIRANIFLLGSKKNSRILFLDKGVSIQARRKIVFGKGIRLGKSVKINAISKDGVTIGDNVNIGDYSIISCTGILSKIGIGFSIGKNSGCGEFSYFGSAGGITIGNNVIMGQNVRFHSENHIFNQTDIPIREQGVTNKGIIIGNDCWIGAGAVFLDGVVVGDGCVIGANSVVNKNIPANSIAVGNPAKIVKMRL